MTIKDKDYNQARSILAQAGSSTAQKSHSKHNTRGGSPDSHGRSLLREAVEEFQAMDVGQPNLDRGMTEPHIAAVERSAELMGIEW